MEDGGVVFFIVLLYGGILALYIILIVRFWKACTAIFETRDQIKNMSFRDTARYLSEVRRGVISDKDQLEAEKSFK